MVKKELKLESLYFSNLFSESFHVSNYMNSVKASNISLIYLRFTPSGCKDIGITKFKFITKT